MNLYGADTIVPGTNYTYKQNSDNQEKYLREAYRKAGITDDTVWFDTKELKKASEHNAEITNTNENIDREIKENNNQI
jgi:hypothetical protein